MSSFQVHVYRLRAEVEEILAALLWEAGTLGLESRDEPGGSVLVEAYFAAGHFDDPLGDRLPLGVEALPPRIVEEGDWLAAYREKAKPFPLGAGFWVDPREPGEGREEAGPPPGRRLLRLPARSAFGIGSHESTRLAVELLEEAGVAGRRVLDVGTGTGVLAFAALALGAAHAVAFDVDFGSVVQARANAALNRAALGGRAPRLFTGVVESLRPSSRFDLALVNILPEVIVGELPEVARLLAAGGEAILSGILAERGDEVLTAAAAAGFVERSRRSAGEWVAFRVGREGDG